MKVALISLFENKLVMVVVVWNGDEQSRLDYGNYKATTREFY